MDDAKRPQDGLPWLLRERAKELECLYRIEELLSKPDADLASVCDGIIKAIPPAWQHPDICRVQISIDETNYTSPDFEESPWVQRAAITVSEEHVGWISVYYSKEMPPKDDGPFLRGETKLLETIAERMGSFIGYQRIRQLFHERKGSTEGLQHDNEWKILLELLRKTDRILFLRISQKMLNYLCWTGISEGQRLVQYYAPDTQESEDELLADSNKPFHKTAPLLPNDFLSDETFKIAADHLTPEEILSFIQRWIQQDKLSFLLKAVVNLNTPIIEVVDAISRYHRMAEDGSEIPSPTKDSVLGTLIRRFFSEQLDYINIAKKYIEVSDFYDLLGKVIFAPESSGRLGGKSAGLFLASQILRRCCQDKEHLGDFKVPKTWYITSDAIITFVNVNNFEEVIEQKYKAIPQVRVEYPNIVQTFKNATFPAEIVQGLSMALDDFGDKPLIVRSSSLLEDRTGAAFSGKYKSLFLANQGTKEERLSALLDAIAEVYASVFGPDPIEYRAERGLLDFHEEMGILIQEVVGQKVGKYYLPAYAGVAFSKNEFRWSPRIKREDGLVRIVPGLGTRAVDRLSDDYPVLVSPGQPGLRVNVTAEEVSRYSPKKIDVIDLETNSFETIEISKLLEECDLEYPAFNDVMSILKDQHIQAPTGLNLDLDPKDLVVTFDGLFTRTPFLARVQQILKTLEEKLDTPVDIEFASDGKDFYLLQCRPQSHSEENAPAIIPHDIPLERIVFTASRFVSNGRVPEITHIVYVDPERYSQITDRATLLAVGTVVGKLNMLLPKRRFVLMGPGRWGSRGDIKLGVAVTYSEINNTAVLIEIARKSGNYVPDLSFGTHFFQDLVEAGIRYLPLYPDDRGTIFNENFLSRSPNLLPEILPEFSYLMDTIRLIDIPSITDGRILQILMNADLGEAVGILAQPRTDADLPEPVKKYSETQSESFWHWRLRMAEHIASQLDPERFGVKGIYLFGSTKSGTAGPSSDIDLLVHFAGNDRQLEMLKTWFEGWSLSLAEMNFLQSGCRKDGILDVYYVTDDDIERKTSYALKIGAITDPARRLAMKKKS
jgi:pyruvate,water dikinase